MKTSHGALLWRVRGLVILKYSFGSVVVVVIVIIVKQRKVLIQK